METKSQPTIIMTAVDSSQIAAIGHDPATNTLAIQFKSKTGDAGSTYHYENFTREHFAEFKNAESIGSHFYKHIKPHTEKFPYTRIEAPASTQATEEAA